MRWLKPAIFATTSVVIFPAFMPTVEAATRNPWTHFGLRPLGMGNAYVAVADDFNALFYNPAGLARLKTWDGEFLNPAVTATSNVNGLVKDSKKLTGGSTSDTLDLVEKNTGENFHVGLSLTPHLIFPNFGFGLGLDVSATTVFHRDVTVDLNTSVRAVLPIAFAKSFLNDRLAVGVGIKVRALAGIDQNFSMDDISAFESSSNKTDSTGRELEDYVKAGTGYGADIGFLFTPQKEYEPTFGLSITDLGGTTYTKYKVKDSELGAPPIQLPSVNVGFSAKPYQTSWSYLMAAIDMHSINQPYSFSKKFNLGLEGGLGNILKLQAGVYQGYYTAGLQFDIGLFNLRVVTYAEELGTQAGFKEDRRIAAQLKILL